MSVTALRLVPIPNPVPQGLQVPCVLAAPPTRTPSSAPSLGTGFLDSLHRRGLISAATLISIRATVLRNGASMNDVLLGSGAMDAAVYWRELARHHGADLIDGRDLRFDRRLIDAIGFDRCLRQRVLPVGRIGPVTVLAISEPHRFNQISADLLPVLGPVRMVIAPAPALDDALTAAGRRQMVDRAEVRVEAQDSCRGWREDRVLRLSLAMFIGLAALTLALPELVIGFIAFWAILTLVACTALKAIAAVRTFGHCRSRASEFRSRRGPGPKELPMVSVLVPLFHEREIAGRLIRRLSRLTYPKDRLEICLVLEEDDTVTQTALAQTHLPHWMRQIVVPRGSVKTKPRAMNYAMDLCRGSIIGVYDAEDAPAPDQIDKVARQFALMGPEVACLQGILDFYNSDTNWLSRCFAVEYAAWFRVILPGLERMGLVLPLGGTTLFFRREVLEEIGGWDAHNVTEDADLGIRLARRGYQTRVINTVTEEEANCRAWPWVKQRSRWLKGYMMTWITHMRNPAQLYRDLGAKRFWGVQLLFLGTVSQFLLAPVLWSFWAFPLGLPHPLSGVMHGGLLATVGVLFAISEAVNIGVGMLAARATRHRRLAWWVPTLHFYFPIGAVAAWKGFYELATCPYYWDKTAHGIFQTPEEIEDERFQTAPV